MPHSNAGYASTEDGLKSTDGEKEEGVVCYCANEMISQ